MPASPRTRVALPRSARSIFSRSPHSVVTLRLFAVDDEIERGGGRRLRYFDARRQYVEFDTPCGGGELEPTPDGIVTMISMNSGTCGRVQFGRRRGTMPVGRRSTSSAPTMRTGPFSNAMFCMVSDA